MVQVDPVKPALKAPGIVLLKLKYDEALSIFAFKINLRRYNWEQRSGGHGGRRVPILAATANAMRGDHERCLDAGMDGYLSKPVQRKSLLQMMGFWICKRDDCSPEDLPPSMRGYNPVCETSNGRGRALAPIAMVATAEEIAAIAPAAATATAAAAPSPGQGPPPATPAPSPQRSARAAAKTSSTSVAEEPSTASEVAVGSAAAATAAGGGSGGATEERPCVLLVVHNATERMLLDHMCQLQGCLAGSLCAC